SNASSPGSQRQGASAHARVFDHAGPPGHSRCRAHACCLPPFVRRRHPEQVAFRSSMAGLCTPLPTLRLYPRRYLRTARGRCGSLLLHRGGLSPPTPCRFHRRTQNRNLVSARPPTTDQRLALGQLSALVESKMGAVAWGPKANTPFPISAHRTVDSNFWSTALRLASLQAHGGAS